jgi:hypothetical protein
MSTDVARLASPRLGIACVALLVLAACERAADAPPSRTETPSAEIAWARAALERNPQLEVIASDPEQQVITIRDRRTGDVQAVKVSELAAAPIAHLQAQQPTASEPQTEAAAPESAASAAQAAAEPATAAEPQSGAQTVVIPPQSTSTEAGYTIERSGGQLRVSGPGVSIVSSGQTANPSQTSAGARASEPIICEGRRMVHLDNREIHVDGDAIIVRNGCEMFITNSRVVAKGTGVTVRNGVVHVSNSHIEGGQGSFDADGSSKMYVRGSTFLGLSRRDELAMVQDQGGNRWR